MPVINLLVGFGRACAPVRCAHPSFWAHCNAKQGAALPTHRSFAAFYSYSKNKIIYQTRAARVKGFSFNSTTETREYTECQALYPVVRIGSPTPHLQESVAPPVWVQGRRHTNFRMRGGGGTNSDDEHTHWYSRYTSQLR